MFEINDTLFVVILSFLVFCFLLDKVFWSAILEIKDKRNTEIEKNENNANKKIKETERISLNIQNQIELLRLTQAKRLEDALQKTESEFKRHETSVQLRLQDDFRRQNRMLASSQSTVLSTISTLAKPLVNQMYDKLLGHKKGDSPKS